MKKKAVFLFFAILYYSCHAANAQDREVILQGTFNFRDIGGYTTIDGKHIKWGKIYRSALLSNLTSEDLQILEVLKMNKVIDLRGPKEITAFPDKIPNGAQYVNLSLGSENSKPDDWAALAERMKKMSGRPDTVRHNYRRNENLKLVAQKYKPIFDALLSLPNDSSLVVHCAGGKDRTGIAAALIEYVLGVSRDQIVQDYELTNTYRERYNAGIAQLLHLKYGVPLEIAQRYGATRPEHMEGFFDQIEQEYGSVDAFVEKELGLDQGKIAKLHAAYLE